MNDSYAFFKKWETHAHKCIEPFENGKGAGLLVNQQFIDLMEHAPCVVFVINHSTSQYEFFSKNAISLIGYSAEEMIVGGVPFGVSLVDESQRENMANYLFPALFDYFTRFSKTNEIKKIRIAYNFKFKRKDGQLRWILQQMSVLETDENGGPLLTLVFMTDLSGLKKDELMDFSVSKLNSTGYYEPIYTTSFPDSKAIPITSREWEIVSLVNEGRTSSEIAELLHISEHTVKNHRKKIMKKFGATTTPGLLDICRKKGLS